MTYKPSEARHGAQRVAVGAKCRKKQHGDCTVQDFGCPCHAVEEVATETRK